MIINAGIERIVVREGYPDKMAVDMLAESGKQVIVLKKSEWGVWDKFLNSA